MPIFVPKIDIKGIPEQQISNSPLSDQQLKKIFKEHDINGDGELNKAELKEAFRHLGARIPVWRAKRALHHADANGDGCISENEMKDLVHYAAKLGYTLK